MQNNLACLQTLQQKKKRTKNKTEIPPRKKQEEKHHSSLYFSETFEKLPLALIPQIDNFSGSGCLEMGGERYRLAVDLHEIITVERAVSKEYGRERWGSLQVIVGAALLGVVNGVNIVVSLADSGQLGLSRTLLLLSTLLSLLLGSLLLVAQGGETSSSLSGLLAVQLLAQLSGEINDEIWVCWLLAVGSQERHQDLSKLGKVGLGSWVEDWEEGEVEDVVWVLWVGEGNRLSSGLVCRVYVIVTGDDGSTKETFRVLEILLDLTGLFTGLALGGGFVAKGSGGLFFGPLLGGFGGLVLCYSGGFGLFVGGGLLGGLLLLLGLLSLLFGVFGIPAVEDLDGTC